MTIMTLMTDLQEEACLLNQGSSTEAKDLADYPKVISPPTGSSIL
jgi:hypothetical protein